jgi:hypothetical protein
MRVLLGGIVGFFLQWILSSAIDFIPDLIMSFLSIAIGGVLGGYIAQQKGWVSGLLVGLFNMGAVVSILLAIGNGVSSRSGVDLPLPSDVWLRLTVNLFVAITAGYIGEKLYRLRYTRQSDS